MKCKCEICGKIEFQEKHHIKSKSFGGSNDRYNIAYLCGNCHTSVHRGEIILEGKFQTTAGFKLIYHRKNEAPIITGQELPNVFLY